MYIKLIGVARASLGELLEDYEDFARQNNILIWPQERAQKIGEIGEIRERYTPHNPYIPDLPHNLETAVNLLITLINQANYLLDHQSTSLEEKFIREGGYSEGLFRKRLEERDKKR